MRRGREGTPPNIYPDSTEVNEFRMLTRPSDDVAHKEKANRRGALELPSCSLFPYKKSDG
jgi:hypothetical protein